MKILVIGGSYFFGRWFVQLAYKENDITVLNRGNIAIGIPEVKELTANRHDINALKALGDIDYDCIVDFCAYEKGDISTIVEAFGKEGKRYVFISTVDVYERGTDKVLSEDAPFEERQFPGPEGAYIAGKVALEKELEEVCSAKGMTFTSIRPAVLYGPANYAPREGIYFEWIDKAGQIITPVDATGHFQPIFVRDAASIVLKIIGVDDKELERAYNLCDNKVEDYLSFAKALHGASKKEFTETPLPVSYIVECEIPLPFPLTAAESETYNSNYLDRFEVNLTPLEVGLQLTSS